MARQNGLLPLQGKLGNIIFYRGKEGNYARTAGTLNRKRVMTDPAFAGSRAAGQAFKHAAQGAGLLRRAMGPQAAGLAETRLAGRLSARMLEVLKTDTAHATAERRIHRGDLDLLRGFAWHRERPLSGVLLAPYTVTADRANGHLSVSFPALYARTDLKAPAGATHCSIIACGAALDFDGNTFESAYTDSGALALDGAPLPLVLTCPVPAGSRLPLVLGMGVVYYQASGGELSPLKDKCAFGIVGTAQEVL